METSKYGRTNIASLEGFIENVQKRKETGGDLLGEIARGSRHTSHQMNDVFCLTNDLKEYAPDQYNDEIKNNPNDGKHKSKSFFSEGKPVTCDKRFEMLAGRLWLEGVPGRFKGIVDGQEDGSQLLLPSHLKESLDAKKGRKPLMPMLAGDANSSEDPSRWASKVQARQFINRPAAAWGTTHRWNDNPQRQDWDEQTSATVLSGRYVQAKQRVRSDFNLSCTRKQLKPLFVNRNAPSSQVSFVTPTKQNSKLQRSKSALPSSYPAISQSDEGSPLSPHSSGPNSLNHSPRFHTSSARTSSNNIAVRSSEKQQTAISNFSLTDPLHTRSQSHSPTQQSLPTSRSTGRRVVSRSLKKIEKANQQNLTRFWAKAVFHMQFVSQLGYQFLNTVDSQRAQRRMRAAALIIQKRWRSMKMKQILRSIKVIRVIVRTKVHHVKCVVAARFIRQFLADQLSDGLFKRTLKKLSWRIILIQRLVRSFFIVGEARITLLSLAWNKHYRLRLREQQEQERQRQFLQKTLGRVKTNALLSNKPTKVLVEVSESDKLAIIRKFLYEERIIFREFRGSSKVHLHNRQIEVSQMAKVLKGEMDIVEAMNLIPVNNYQILRLLTGPESDRLHTVIDNAIFRYSNQSKKKKPGEGLVSGAPISNVSKSGSNLSSTMVRGV